MTVNSVKNWFTEHSTLALFLLAQAAAILAYSVRLETRVSTLEIRGSPHLTIVDNRLTVLESLTAQNKASVDKIIEVMTRELNDRRREDLPK